MPSRALLASALQVWGLLGLVMGAVGVAVALGLRSGAGLLHVGSQLLLVVASAALVALGLPRADPVVGLLITAVILKITWDSWRLVSTTDPGEMVEHDH